MRTPTLIQDRGGLIPGTPPQRWCDACRRSLDPADAVELTMTRPSRQPGVKAVERRRWYLHAGCSTLDVGDAIVSVIQ